MYGVSLVVTFFFFMVGIIYFHEKQLYFKVNDIKVLVNVNRVPIVLKEALI